MWEGEEEVGGLLAEPILGGHRLWTLGGDHRLWRSLGGHRLGTLAEPALAEPILGGTLGGSIGELLIE